jgi:hypothetical protein
MRRDGSRRRFAAVGLLALGAALSARPRPASAQDAPPASRVWRTEDRSFLTDLTVVTAVAATRNLLYAATLNGLAVYDRPFRRLRETVGPLDGWPPGTVTAMAADPDDDTAWLAGQGRWMSWAPFLRRLDSGPLPGACDAVVLDARMPSRGAWFHTQGGWYFVARGALAAVPAADLPPPGARLGGLSAQGLIARVPALDAVRFRMERDENNRDWRMTSAAVAPVGGEIYVGTAGNGVFAVDPVSYATERFPAGLAGAATSAVAFLRDRVCAAADQRLASPRRGITCFDESFGDARTVEMMGLGGLPGNRTRRLLLTQRAVWAATDQGLLRADRRGGRPVLLVMREGLPSDDVYALVPARTGVWVGTAGGLALVADTGAAPVVTRRLPSGPVVALASAWDTLWAGTPSGLALLPPRGDALLLVDGPGPVRESIVALAFRGDTLVAATLARFVLHTAAGWEVTDPPGRPIGRFAALAADTAGGVWVAGEQGLAFFDPSRHFWSALVLPGDVPFPVRDVLATRDWVWAATDLGLIRYDRRILRP